MKNQFRVGDFVQRFDGTVIRFNGVPVYVRVNNPGRTTLSLYKLSGVLPGHLPINEVDGYDERIDVSSCPLGYINYGGFAYYIERRPQRQYRQGITTRCLEISAALARKPGHRAPSYDNILFSDEFEKMVLDDFPDLKTVLKTLRANEEGSMAISRKVALEIDNLGIVRVFYRKEQIGWMAPGEDVVNVPNSEIAEFISRELSIFAWKVS